jgi:hypothetical protein
LESDVLHQGLFSAAGYARTGSTQILHCRLAEFRAVVNRQQMAIRRRTIVEPHIDALPRTWWDAQMSSQHDFTSFRLAANDRRTVWAEAMFWDMEPLASSWGIHAAGLLHFEQFDECAESGAETFLIGDSLKQLQANGVTLVETQVSGSADQRLKLLAELGFKVVDTGTTFMKIFQQT